MAKMDLSEFGAKVIESVEGEHCVDGFRFDLDIVVMSRSIDRISEAAHELIDALDDAPTGLKKHILDTVFVHPRPMLLDEDEEDVL